jgi:hypothetical protein
MQGEVEDSQGEEVVRWEGACRALQMAKGGSPSGSKTFRFLGDEVILLLMIDVPALAREVKELLTRMVDSGSKDGRRLS